MTRIKTTLMKALLIYVSIVLHFSSLFGFTFDIFIYMQLKIFMCSVGEEAELRFSIFHKGDGGKQVSEEYLYLLTYFSYENFIFF